MDSQQWYEQNIILARKTGKSKCCSAPILDDGECSEGCCDRWKCSQCGKTWYIEVGD